jgi:hypothetical protein
VNRRQRAAEGGASAAAGARWFERAGATVLGQRPDGPIVDHVDAVAFVEEADAGAPIATLVCFACHPVCAGKDVLLQTADYVGACREAVEAATQGAPAVFIMGACGDVNPLVRGKGLAAAAEMGRTLGAMVVSALQGASAAAATAAFASASAPVIASREIVAQLETAPLPSEAEALAFAAEQQAWLAETGSAEAAACVAYAAERLALVRAGPAQAAAPEAG